MNPATKVQILDEAISISYMCNTHRKTMNSIILPSIMDK